MHRILVPLDGSVLSEAVLPLAEALARDYEAELHVFRAVRALGFEALDPEVELDLSGEAETYLTRIGRELQERGLSRVSWSVASGKADQAIAQAAGQHRADLITMATHGRGGLARLLLGSVAESVVRQAPAPVLLVRGQPSWMRGGIGDILVPLDGSDLSGEVLPVVERLAGPLDFTIHLLHVVQPLRSYAEAEVSPQLAEMIAEQKATAEDLLSKRAGSLEAKGLRVRLAVRTGSVVNRIQEYVGEERIGLVAMTTHGLTGLGRVLLGSVSERVLKDVPVPVLLWRARSG